jgi:hypothetical protein
MSGNGKTGQRTGDVVIYYPGDRWNAWHDHYAGTKLQAQMMAKVAAVVRARAQWLGDLLVEILSSDIPTGDVAIEEHADGSTVVAIRGAPLHRFSVRPSWIVPAPMPPSPPPIVTPRKVEPTTAPLPERRGIGDGDYDAAFDRLTAFVKRRDASAAEIAERGKRTNKQARALRRALAAADENRRPNVDGLENYDVVSVPDPMESEAQVHIKGVRRIVQGGSPMRVKNDKPATPRLRVRSIRDNPLLQMAKRRQLGDAETTVLRVNAGTAWQNIFDRANPSRGMALTEAVDGGGALDPVVAQLEACQRLAKISQLLGLYDDALASMVLGRRMTLQQVCGALGYSRRADEEAIGARFRALLDALSSYFEAQAVGSGQRRRADRFDQLAKHSWNPKLFAAIGVAAALGDSECRPGGARHLDRALEKSRY